MQSSSAALLQLSDDWMIKPQNQLYDLYLIINRNQPLFIVNSEL